MDLMGLSLNLGVFGGGVFPRSDLTPGIFPGIGELFSVTLPCSELDLMGRKSACESLIWRVVQRFGRGSGVAGDAGRG